MNEWLSLKSIDWNIVKLKCLNKCVHIFVCGTYLKWVNVWGRDILEINIFGKADQTFYYKSDLNNFKRMRREKRSVRSELFQKMRRREKRSVRGRNRERWGKEKEREINWLLKDVFKYFSSPVARSVDLLIAQVTVVCFLSASFQNVS